MFEINSQEDRVVKLNVPIRHAKQARELGLPSSIEVRLIKVILPSNEIEVLATSLLKREKLSLEDFKELYSLRWGIETFFGKLKSRLSLENFTEKTSEAVRQDFWSTIFISNLETIMTEDVLSDLNNKLKDGQLKKTITKSISFNAIKNLAFELFYTEFDKDRVIKELEKLFIMNLGLKRINRNQPRKRISDTKSLNFQKRGKKQVF